ncbi:MAG: ArsA-related P-loop ATPase [Myxococcota bacterium]|nr:ArsA-related P-loop ATPase [Myxococcota bacterium]
MSLISQLLTSKKVLVCCGAGGVGKTTVSASLAIAAARLGLRVLVVTIDPSRRLAEALGVDRNPPEPVPVSDEFSNVGGLTGSLSAWMLDPQLVADRVVQSFSSSRDEAERLLKNPIYQNVAAMVAGMQEYTAVQALYEFVSNDAYDLVILDTPPSRDALRFLDAPARASSFLDRRIFNLFVPGEGGLIRRMATRLIEKVMDVAFGESTRLELQQFFKLFGALLGQLNHNQTEMKAFFASDAVSFLMITSPAPAALVEAQFFGQRATEELNLHVSGFVLNRSIASHRHCQLPDVSALDGEPDKVLKQAIEKLVPLAQREEAQVNAHHTLATDMARSLGEGHFTIVLPNLGPDASETTGLVTLSEALVDDHNVVN